MHMLPACIVYRRRLYPGLLEAVAVAHVVHGFVFRQPAYVKMAVALLKVSLGTMTLGGCLRAWQGRGLSAG